MALKSPVNPNLTYGPDGQFPFPSPSEGAAYALANGVNACPGAPDNAIYIGWISAPQIIINRVQSSAPSYVSPTDGALDSAALDTAALDMTQTETNE